MDSPETTDQRLTDLYALWRQRRGERMLPDRADFPPDILKPWLGNLVLLELTDDGSYRYRLYGTNFVFRFGVEMTRRRIDDLPPEQSAALRQDYDAVVATRQPLVRRYTSGFDILDLNRHLGIQRMETWERLVLPLSDGSGEVRMLLVGAYEQAMPEDPLDIGP